MPIINVKVIEDFFTQEQKNALIPALTDAFCRATFEAARPYIYVVIEEVKQGQWGLASHPLPMPCTIRNESSGDGRIATDGDASRPRPAPDRRSHA